VRSSYQQADTPSDSRDPRESEKRYSYDNKYDYGYENDEEHEDMSQYYGNHSRNTYKDDYKEDQIEDEIDEHPLDQYRGKREELLRLQKEER
jgi:hypothetical protein